MAHKKVIDPIFRHLTTDKKIIMYINIQVKISVYCTYVTSWSFYMYIACEADVFLAVTGSAENNICELEPGERFP